MKGYTGGHPGKADSWLEPPTFCYDPFGKFSGKTARLKPAVVKGQWSTNGHEAIKHLQKQLENKHINILHYMSSKLLSLKITFAIIIFGKVNNRGQL